MLTRREFIHLGAAGAFGLGLNLPSILRAQERARVRGQETRDVSLIFLYLHGGLSTIDTWDLKPDAPAEFRGDFRPIPTNVTGIQVSEHMPRSATVRLPQPSACNRTSLAVIPVPNRIAPVPLPGLTVSWPSPMSKTIVFWPLPPWLLFPKEM